VHAELEEMSHKNKSSSSGTVTKKTRQALSSYSIFIFQTFLTVLFTYFITKNRTHLNRTA